MVLSAGRILGKVSARLPGSREVAFALVKINRLGGCGVCFMDAAGCGEDLGEVEQGVGVLAQQVRLRGQRHRRVCALGTRVRLDRLRHRRQ
jgi:hypothetical protein